MPNTSISNLAAGAAVSATDLVPNVQTVGVGPVKTTAAQLKTFMSASPTFTGTANGADLTLSGTLTTGTWASSGFTLSSSGIITESTTTRTLGASDNGKVIYCTSSSAVTINCAAGLGAGFSCTIIQGGTGKVTIAANGQTLVSYSSLFSAMGQYAVISLICPVANTFLAAGNLGV